MSFYKTSLIKLYNSSIWKKHETTWSVNVFYSPTDTNTYETQNGGNILLEIRKQIVYRSVMCNKFRGVNLFLIVGCNAIADMAVWKLYVFSQNRKCVIIRKKYTL